MSDIMDLNKIFKNLDLEQDVYDICTMTLDTCNKISEELEKVHLDYDTEGAKLVNGNVVLPGNGDEIHKKMAELGIMSLIAPEKYDGAGMPYKLHTACIEIISRQCPSVGVGLCVHGTAIDMIENLGNDNVKEKYIPQLASGKKMGAIAFTEANAGSDLGAAKSKALLDDSGEKYIINGVKQFITNGGYADIYILLALTDPQAGPKRLSSFVLDRTEVEGFSIQKLEDKMGIKASPTAEIVLENCKIPKENLIGIEGKGFRNTLWGLNGGRIGIAAQATGIADTAFKKAFNYAQERSQFGVTVNKFPTIAERLALMKAKINASRISYIEASDIKDKGENYIAEAAASKLFASENAEWVTREAIQVHGGYGYMKEYGMEKLYRDSRITTIYEGTNEIIRLVVLRDIFAEKDSKLIGGIEKRISDAKKYNDLTKDIESALMKIKNSIKYGAELKDKFAQQLYSVYIVDMCVSIYIASLMLNYTAKTGELEDETELIIFEMSREVEKLEKEIRSNKSELIKKFPIS